ncbi:MAG: flavodoxin-dependent (E)-4-hydroxy-3-methylbut-2-enyl-diphosphate synthase, partial [Bacteroidota bacterium]|nr:flavodoxin-dependent (E)-4-hydroxy-3-methylbut-2-enyl-diphosphate synthase [Bacteroidota bacterium]
CYPLHLGVTEAGDGEDGRVKSAAGIGTLLEDGIGDTIRVSLTEDPEFEIPVCKDLLKRYEEKVTSLKLQAASYEPRAASDEQRRNDKPQVASNQLTTNIQITKPNIQSASVPFSTGGEGLEIRYSPFSYKRRETFSVDNIGGHHVPVVIADLSKIENITPQHLQSVGYTYDEGRDKWNISDAAADYIFTGHQLIHFALPGTLKVITYPATWQLAEDKSKYFPLYEDSGFAQADVVSDELNFVMTDCFSDDTSINDFTYLDAIANKPNVVLCLSSKNKHAMLNVRRMFIELMNRSINNPVVLMCDSNWQTADEHLIHYATECGALLLDGFGDGLWLGMTVESYKLQAASYKQTSGRNYLNNATCEQFINNTAFTILQATRTRISKTEYISCPSCGRTLFDLQETTAKIRAVTNHLKGVKIAIMGCIVNGPGEMADADFGYVGSGVGKITLYRGKDVVKRNVNSDIAVDELVTLLKESDAWIEPIVSEKYKDSFHSINFSAVRNE